MMRYFVPGLSVISVSNSCPADVLNLSILRALQYKAAASGSRAN